MDGKISRVYVYKMLFGFFFRYSMFCGKKTMVKYPTDIKRYACESLSEIQKV